MVMVARSNSGACDEQDRLLHERPIGAHHMRFLLYATDFQENLWRDGVLKTPVRPGESKESVGFLQNPLRYQSCDGQEGKKASSQSWEQRLSASPLNNQTGRR